MSPLIGRPPALTAFLVASFAAVLAPGAPAATALAALLAPGAPAVAALAAGPAPGELAQVPEPVRPDLARLASGQGAQVFNRLLTPAVESGRAVATLDARAGDGGAIIDGVQLGEGIIEVDLRGKDVAQQSFLGIAFHVVDWTAYEAVYFRPFNFRASGEEQRSHSVQYIAHPVNTWQKLRADRPGQFEKAIDPPPDPNGWFRARIVLANSKIEVYVNGAKTPSLVVDDLGDAKSGGVALWAGNGSDGSYANLVITPTSPPGPPPPSRQTVFQAAATGNLARLRALVDADPAQARAMMPLGGTPLHLAAANGQAAAAEYLLSKGADVNADTRHSGRPIDTAFETGRTEMVRLLESKGGRFTPLRFDVTTITPAIHRVAFPWGMMNNVLVFSGSDGAVLVDSGFTRRALDELRKVVARFSPAGVRFVVNSHGHGDHVAGNAIAPAPAAVISSATLVSPPPGLAITPRAEPLRGPRGRTLPAGCSWRVGDSEIVLIPRPGLHSDADLIVWFPKESVVDMGDLLLSESVPAVENLPAYIAFLDDVLDVFPENTTFVSGHGRDLDAAGVRAYRADLEAMVELVRVNLAAGRTAEQMVKDDVLKAYKAKYSLLDFLRADTLIPRAVASLRQEGGIARERAVVEGTIRGNICWALTKDRALAESTMVHDASLYIVNPTSKPTAGWDELVKNFAVWMDPRFKATACDVRDLRIDFSRSGEVAWWSAMLDDLAEWDGKPTGWKDTRWTGVLEKRNGRWLIVQMHFSFAADKVRAEALAEGRK